MRILALALGIPFPPLGGGLIRTFQLLRSIASRHEVVLAAYSYGEPHEAPPYPLQLEVVPWEWSQAYQNMIGSDVDAAKAAFERLAYHDDQPWLTSVIEPAAMEAAIAGVLRSPVDLVLFEGTPLARFLPAIPREVPRVLDLFDVHSVAAHRDIEESSHLDRTARVRDAERTLQFERHAAQSCDACLAVSTQDAAAARSLLGASQVHVVPNGVDTTYFVPSNEPTQAGSLLFTGRMSYAPNADAVVHFATDVLPLIRREVSHACLHVVGDSPPPQVSALASDAVHVHGRVDDVRPYQWNAEVVVVPIRAGGGTRLKVLEAAASGKGIVSTSLGIEGLAFRDESDVLVADSASGMAAAVVRLLRDSRRRRELGARARAIACDYDWATIGESFRVILERTVSGRV